MPAHWDGVRGMRAAHTCPGELTLSALSSEILGRTAPAAGAIPAGLGERMEVCCPAEGPFSLLCLLR